MMVDAASTRVTSWWKQELLSGYADAHMCHVLVEGGGSKLNIWDEKLEIDLWLDWSPTTHMWPMFV
jgi:hypothetical protein